jgi:uncharacterized membrane protein
MPTLLFVLGLVFIAAGAGSVILIGYICNDWSK